MKFFENAEILSVLPLFAKQPSHPYSSLTSRRIPVTQEVQSVHSKACKLIADSSVCHGTASITAWHWMPIILLSTGPHSKGWYVSTWILVECVNAVQSLWLNYSGNFASNWLCMTQILSHKRPTWLPILCISTERGRFMPSFALPESGQKLKTGQLPIPTSLQSTLLSKAAVQLPKDDSMMGYSMIQQIRIGRTWLSRLITR